MKKRVFLIVGLLVFLGIAAVVLQLEWISIPGFSRGAKSESPVREKEEIGPVVKLSPLVVNLKDEGGAAYVKATIALELAKKNQIEEMTKSLPLVTDLIILTLGDKRLEELKQPEAKETLKLELLSKMNQHLPPKTIKRLYFDEFLYE